MSEEDRTDLKRTWPPQGLTNEIGNNDQTVITRVPEDLLRRLLDSGSVAIDDPDRNKSEDA